MKRIIEVIYTEPIVFLGVIAAGVAAAGALEIIPFWLAPIVAAIVVPLERHFVTPVVNVPDAPFEGDLPFAGELYEPNLDRDRLGE